ncbi:hypothetical protein [Limnoraphis robusta]|nr:hypothetical protein [Limnoraphis robusta]
MNDNGFKLKGGKATNIPVNQQKTFMDSNCLMQAIPLLGQLLEV